MDRINQTISAVVDRVAAYGQTDGASLATLYRLAGEPPPTEIMANQDAMCEMPVREAVRLAQKALGTPRFH